MKDTSDKLSRTVKALKGIEDAFHKDLDYIEDKVAKVEAKATDNKDEIDILQFHNKNLRSKLNVTDGIEHKDTSAFTTPVKKERTPTPIPANIGDIPLVEALGKRARRPPTAAKIQPVMHLQARKKAKLQQTKAVEELKQNDTNCN